MPCRQWAAAPLFTLPPGSSAAQGQSAEPVPLYVRQSRLLGAFERSRVFQMLLLCFRKQPGAADAALEQVDIVAATAAV